MENYKLGKIIGLGGNSKIYKACNDKGEKYAIKIMKKCKNKKYQKEISFHSKLKNENIIKFFDFFEDEIKIYIVLELCGDNLYNYKKDKKLEEKEIISIFSQVVNAIDYLHKNNIVHRDIKPENILENIPLGNSLGNIKIWKLSDFGFVDKEGEFNESLGTPDYLAPEIVSYQKYEGSPVDIWTLGILLYELIYDNPPFYKQTYNKTYIAILSEEPKFENKTSLESLIKKMLIKNPSKRIKIQDVLNFLREYF
jgi:serine/threonine protein kinase